MIAALRLSRTNDSCVAAPILAALRRGAGPRPFLPQMHFASGWGPDPICPVCLLAVSLMRMAFPFML